MMENFYYEINKNQQFEDKFLILIIYDIVKNSTRTKFFKFLSGYATHVQKSCFETYLNDDEFEKLLSKIEIFINKETDNVRIYKLSAYGEVFNFGTDNGNYLEKVIII
ncbi:MAG: CRISPR-associated endonuclease Cas2 [Tissierellia bacterium]|nr:CRISPR-associated endonuclease Cas2 [Tissierellia bacterium]